MRLGSKTPNTSTATSRLTNTLKCSLTYLSNLLTYNPRPHRGTIEHRDILRCLAWRKIVGNAQHCWLLHAVVTTTHSQLSQRKISVVVVAEVYSVLRRPPVLLESCSPPFTTACRGVVLLIVITWQIVARYWPVCCGRVQQMRAGGCGRGWGWGGCDDGRCGNSMSALID